MTMYLCFSSACYWAGSSCGCGVIEMKKILSALMKLKRFASRIKWDGWAATDRELSDATKVPHTGPKQDQAEGESYKGVKGTIKF